MDYCNGNADVLKVDGGDIGGHFTLDLILDPGGMEIVQ